MASKLKVNEFTTTSGSGSVAFAKGGADMTGDMSVNRNRNYYLEYKH